MKKFLAIVVIAGALVACNNSGDSTTSSDSPAMVTDSGQTMMNDTSGRMMGDTMKMADTTNKMSPK